MKNETKLDGALCAGVGTADAAQAAPASGKKKYVSPTMQVIPLGPQRMLATSGVSGPPVQVTLTPMGFDYYIPLFHCVDGNSVASYDGDGYDCSSAVNIGAHGWDFKCGDLGSSFMSKYATSVTALRNYADSRTDCSLITVYWTPADFRLLCGPGRLEVPSPIPVVSFGDGVDWTASDFFANAQFDACSGDGRTFSGTYDGRRFEGTIEYMDYVGGGNSKGIQTIELF
ncbi:MAG: hypothetical protein IJ722_00580 [Alloprevotella sp.]|nr:hypothetical protein [Alloprevotella sp.]